MCQKMSLCYLSSTLRSERMKKSSTAHILLCLHMSESVQQSSPVFQSSIWRHQITWPVSRLHILISLSTAPLITLVSSNCTHVTGAWWPCKVSWQYPSGRCHTWIMFVVNRLCYKQTCIYLLPKSEQFVSFVVWALLESEWALSAG